MSDDVRHDAPPAAGARYEGAGYAGRGRAHDGVRWGPIVAGLVVAITTLALLSVLGIAIGLTGEPTIAGQVDIETAAWVWGIATMVLAFLVGGMVAAWVADVDTAMGVFNGFMVGALAVSAILVAAAIGLGNLLGTIGANIGQFTDVVLAADTDEALDAAQAQVADAEGVAWGTFLGLLGALVLAAVGGALGSLASRGGERRTDAGRRAPAGAR